MSHTSISDMQVEESRHFLGWNSVMVESCRLSPQTSMKYAAVATRRPKEHEVILELRLSYQVRTKG